MTEIRIGLTDNPKELAVEVNEDPEKIAKRLTEAVEKEGGMLWLTDTRGKRVGVPAGKIAYIELEPEGAQRPVGFGAR